MNENESCDLNESENIALSLAPLIIDVYPSSPLASGPREMDFIPEG